MIFVTTRKKINKMKREIVELRAELDDTKCELEAAKEKATKALQKWEQSEKDRNKWYREAYRLEGELKAM